MRKHSLSQSFYGEYARDTTESIRVYASCLRSDISYLTILISATTTASQVITGLLNKFKLKHVDRNMFFLTMEVTIEEGKTTVIKISDSDKLSEMVRCNPWQDSKVRLCSKHGGFIRVYDTVLMPDSVYKSIRISGDTTVRDVIDIVLACCNSDMTQDQLCLVQTGPDNMQQTGQGTTHQTVVMPVIRRVMDSEKCRMGESMGVKIITSLL